MTLLQELKNELKKVKIDYIEKEGCDYHISIGDELSIIEIYNFIDIRVKGDDGLHMFSTVERTLSFIINVVVYGYIDDEEDEDQKNCKYDQEQVGHFTTMIKLKNIANKYERMKVYSDILISNIANLSSKKQQYVVINEKGDGGIIYGYRKDGKDYESKLFTMLQDANPGKDIETLGITTSIEGGYYKRGFVIKNKKQAKMKI